MDRPGPEGEPGLSRIQEESEMAEQFASGWENPDKHEPMAERPRPMFDEQGKPVSEAPPAPEVEQALEELDNIVRPGDVAARMRRATAEGGPTDFLQSRPGGIAGRIVTTGEAAPLALMLSTGEKVRPLDHQRQLAEIRKLALDALEDASPAGWAVALDKIAGLAK
jgi:hypothetical protein